MFSFFQQTRQPTTRRLANENDENNSSRVTTRAKKAATLSVDELAMPAKGALQQKKTAVGSTAAAGLRKRSALGDVSNVNKPDAIEGGKKAAMGKTGLTSKAQPTRVQKKTTRPTSRASGPTSASTKKPLDERRTGSGAGGIALKNKATVAPKQPLVPAPVSAKPPVVPAPADPINGDGEFPAVDPDDIPDPLMVAEYATEIFEYLHDLEVKSLPNPNYMSHQDDLEWKTRGILVDWLIEVHTRFHLLPETLFLAVNIVDRFLSEKVVQLDNFQLVGITAMFIASKYEEVLSPHVENFKRITDDGFSEAEILSAERFVLSTLDYDLSYPNPMNFLRRVSKADNYDIQSRTIGKYLMEISLLDHRFMGIRPSHVAAAAMYLARLMLDRGPWDKTLAHYATYTEEEVEPVVQLMVDYLARPVVHEAFFKKYASKKFLKASILSRQWAKKNADLFGIDDSEVSLYQL